MKNKIIILNNYDIEELSNKIFDYSKDMDCQDYEEENEKIKSDLQEALYQIKAIAQNEYNKDCWRTFWNTLQNI